MLVIILLIVIALVSWSLHLMQQAADRREFSLMLAGTLVAFSAAAMMAVYFLMGSYIGYVTSSPRYSLSNVTTMEGAGWDLPIEAGEDFEALPLQQTVVFSLPDLPVSPLHP